MRFEPIAVPGGASRVGHSYITKFANCERDFFNEFIRPLVDLATGELLGRGIQPIHVPLNLLTGRLAHEGFAAWYASGCRDGEDTGEYNIDLALDTMKMHWLKAKGHNEYENDEGADNDWLRLEVMLRSYHDTYGPRGYARDWPTIKVVHDSDGRPVVERELETLLAPGYLYSCRLDLAVWHHGFLKVMEHKTPSAYGVRYYKQAVPYEAQYTGQMWCMRELSPSEHTNKVLVNLVVKERSAASKFAVAERETASRSDAELERWRRGALHLLSQIDVAVGGFEEALNKGMDIEPAADLWFPLRGTRTGRCHAYGRPCDYLALCAMPTMEPGVLRNFRARTEVERTALKEKV